MGSFIAPVILSVVVLMVIAMITQTQAAFWSESETLPYEIGKEKMTKLHFYIHDIASGPNPTAIRIAQAPTTNASSTLFGLMIMMDDPLTEGPDPNSKLVGRAQGMYGFTAQNELAIIMAVSYVFTSNDKFNGSTLSVLSRNPTPQTVRQFSIVGGTGVFRFARGVVDAKTYSSNSVGDAVVEYNLTVIHY